MKVFKKIGFQLSKNDIDNVSQCVPEAIERVLRVVKGKLDKYVRNPQAVAPLKESSPNRVVLANKGNGGPGGFRADNNQYTSA